jgi:hypothetical protein
VAYWSRGRAGELFCSAETEARMSTGMDNAREECPDCLDRGECPYCMGGDPDCAKCLGQNVCPNCMAPPVARDALPPGAAAEPGAAPDPAT